MNIKILFIILFAIITTIFFINKNIDINTIRENEVVGIDQSSLDSTDIESTTIIKTAILAGGCFWCVEADMEKVIGVIDVVSGYSGGNSDNPDYKNYSANNHSEVVKITYDESIVDYSHLIIELIKHIDPTDSEGSFVDRGLEYAPAIYYSTEEERQIAMNVITSIDSMNIYDKPVSLIILPVQKFWPAEDYHQDYYKNNPIRYRYYRANSGRDTFINKYINKINTELFIQRNTINSTDWKTYIKPSKAELLKILTPLQYKVTQEKGTESPFKNEYDKNYEQGIYVDILSGEPLFSSIDKYDSGTGWPSFVKPIAHDAVSLREDREFFSTRVEVRSSIADSHLGHVFDDGPADRGGKRYCMNSSALRFVPKDKMINEGYGEYLGVI